MLHECMIIYYTSVLIFDKQILVKYFKISKNDKN
jgi:hypothetical protein